MTLREKVALITGGTSGIGRATGKLFCREGAKVVIAGRTVARGEETVEMIKKEGGEATYVQTDVSKASEVKNLVREALRKYGRIDILFNNAGVHSPRAHARLEEASEEEWERVIDVNLKGVFLCTKYTVPIMKNQGGGVIINTSSTYSFVGGGDIAYCASKGGVLAFTKAVALELGKYHIRVNSIHPGTTVGTTPNGYVSFGRPFSRERYETRARQFPIGRLGSYEDIAKAVLFLASDDSSFITGASLLVDGGFTAQ
jgi:NAD(P)-dependent dehydrogenase (short-subunit alcohol dehydrogenase family)